MRALPLVIFVVCAVAAVGLFLGFSFFPDQHQIQDALAIRSEIEKEVHRLKAVSSRLAAVQQELIGAEGRLQAAEGENLVPGESASDVTSWLRTVPQKHGLSATLNFSRARRQDFYIQLPFQLSMTGSGSGFKKFLAQWEREATGLGMYQLNIFWEDNGIVRATIAGALFIKRPN